MSFDMNVNRIIGNDLKRGIGQDDNCMYPTKISKESHIYKLKCFVICLGSAGSTSRMRTTWLLFR
jgi:hypothetical protein